MVILVAEPNDTYEVLKFDQVDHFNDGDEKNFLGHGFQQYLGCRSRIGLGGMVRMLAPYNICS